jgi:hypothetical protein
MFDDEAKKNDPYWSISPTVADLSGSQVSTNSSDGV